MLSSIRVLSGQSALGLALLRAVMGVVLGYQGYLKVFTGHLAIPFFASLGIPVPQLFGPLVSFLELGGGFLLFIGVFTRYLGALYTVEFLVAAYLTLHHRGPAALALPMMMLAGSVVLATNGAGALGIDRPGQRWEP